MLTFHPDPEQINYDRMLIMSGNYDCRCGYKWTSRKSYGCPARCPKCGGTDIRNQAEVKSDQVSSWLSETIFPRSHATDILNDAIFSAPPNETPSEKIERLKRIREVIRAKVQAE